uniref:PDZ and LIM domain protein 7-like isoform X1 n=2 Tax=Styela clava TaxID=7725 RepID=UPI0019399191|nr:PDZ and LIM domain protein 7-like isoform X1 [Styela clava]
MDITNEFPDQAFVAEEMAHEVYVNDGPPWGFRISGGADVYKPIIISRVTPGSPASKAGLKANDVIVRLNGIGLQDLPRHQVEEMIVNADGTLRLMISSGIKQFQHGAPTAADPAWVALAQKMEKPREIGEEAAEGGLVTIGKQFGGVDKHPVHVTSSTPSIFEARRNPQAMPPNAVIPDIRVVPDTNRCQECQKALGKEYTTVSGLNFHPRCFHCAAPNCQGRLDRGFIIEGDRPYCADCHDKYFARPCARCGRAIVGQVYHALNHQWHLDCFKCFKCGQPFLDGIFYMEEGKLYCDTDYKKLFSSACDTCGSDLGPGDKVVTVGPRRWHDRCFKCQRCSAGLQGKKFVRKNSLPMCQNCAVAVK